MSALLPQTCMSEPFDFFSFLISAKLLRNTEFFQFDLLGISFAPFGFQVCLSGGQEQGVTHGHTSDMDQVRVLRR